MQPGRGAALRAALGLVRWDPYALAEGVDLRRAPSPRSGLVLGDGERSFAWLENPATCRYAPEALTASISLRMGRVRGRRFAVADGASGTELVAMEIWRLRTGATLEPVLGDRLRLATTPLGSDWRARDGDGQTVLTIGPGRDGAWLSLTGDGDSGIGLPTVLAAAYMVAVLRAATVPMGGS